MKTAWKHWVQSIKQKQLQRTLKLKCWALIGLSRCRKCACSAGWARSDKALTISEQKHSAGCSLRFTARSWCWFAWSPRRYHRRSLACRGSSTTSRHCATQCTTQTSISAFIGYQAFGLNDLFEAAMMPAALVQPCICLCLRVVVLMATDLSGSAL